MHLYWNSSARQQSAARPERAYKQHALKAHKQHALKAHKQHALKGQKLLAQGNALGIMAISNAPCKGKSFINCPKVFKAFALTGRQVCEQNNPGRCPGLGASALSGRAAYMSFCPFRVCCLHELLPFTLRPEIFNSLRPVTVGSGRTEAKQAFVLTPQRPKGAITP